MIRSLGNLYRSVVARWTSETDSSWEVVSDAPSDAPAPESTAVPEQAPLQTASECRANGFVPVLVLDRQVQLDLLATSDLTALGRYWHPALEFLYADPGFENSPTQPDIRISRAVRAGVSARQVQFGSQSNPLACLRGSATSGTCACVALNIPQDLSLRIIPVIVQLFPLRTVGDFTQEEFLIHLGQKLKFLHISQGRVCNGLQICKQRPL